METTDIKVTVAVAVYRVDNVLLEECVKSILEQSLRELEILLIGDGTTNENVVLMNRFAQKDDRVIVINNQENGGLSKIRNQAFSVAKGRYLTFVDSDDWIDSDVLKTMYEAAEKVNFPDMVGWTYTLVNGEKRIHTNYIGPNKKFYKGEDVKLLQAQVLDPTFGAGKLQIPMFVTAWAKLYRMDFIKSNGDVRFPEHLRSGGEDMPFTYRLLGKTKNFLLVENYGYYYRRHRGSVTSNNSLGMWDNRKQWIEELAKYIDENENNMLLIGFDRFCLNHIIGVMMTLQNAEGGLDKKLLKKTMDEMLNEPNICKAIKNLRNLRFNYKKRIFFQFVKHRCYGTALFLAKRALA